MMKKQPWTLRFLSMFLTTREVRLRVQVPLRSRCVRPAHSDAKPGRPRRAHHETGGGEKAVAEAT